MGTWNHKKTKLGFRIFIFIAVYHMFSYVHVDGRSISSDKTIELVNDDKGAIKTIQSEDGDIIDCVNIYKQPAFNHPLLKNHTIQMKPSSYPRGMKEEKFEAGLLQGWHKNGECPQGTIPIFRAQKHHPNRTKAFFHPRKPLQAVTPPNHEYAQVSVVDGNYFGASARLNVWNPTTSDNEFSLAQIWILSGHGAEMNTVEAGWQAHPRRKQPQLFIFWTSDGYQDTGCYNLECPGFVQTNNKFGFGGEIKPVSTYGGKPREISIYIHKDKQSGNWWLRIQEIDLGYWPGSIFTRLSNRAEGITWGGEVVNLEQQGRHTSTQMGSGHFSSEGYTKASYIRNLRYVEESGAIKDARNVVPYVTRPECYDLQMGNIQNFGTHFFYGGPGYSDKCK